MRNPWRITVRRSVRYPGQYVARLYCREDIFPFWCIAKVYDDTPEKAKAHAREIADDEDRVLYS